jgi:crotonobetainyl-CoA:carnitine CoA-transferase CaiB-like acyl-CoA transferase
VVVHSPTFPGEWDKHVALLRRYGAAEDLDDPVYQDPAFRRTREAQEHLAEVTERFIARIHGEEIWAEAQENGVIWVTVRAPEDNLDDPHFRLRGAVGPVDHPELGRTFAYPTVPRAQGDLPWRSGPRAPFLGEHNAEIIGIG